MRDRRPVNRSARTFAAPPAGYVLRGDDANIARQAVVRSDLVMSPFAGVDYADPRLVDPRMHELVEEARSEARALGYADGQADGFEAGRVAGLEMMAGEIEKMRAAAEADRTELREEFAALWQRTSEAVEGALDYQVPMIEELRDLIANLAVDIAEELVGHHLVVGECAAVDAVRRALEQIPRHMAVTLRIHPSDAREVQDYTTGLIEYENVRVVHDPNVPHGDVRAEAENLEVTVALSDALAEVRKVLHP